MKRLPYFHRLILRLSWGAHLSNLRLQTISSRYGYGAIHVKMILKILIFSPLGGNLKRLVSVSLIAVLSAFTSAQTPMTPGGNIANPEQQVLSPLVGKWNCSGRFARSGKPIENATVSRRFWMETGCSFNTMTCLQIKSMPWNYGDMTRARSDLPLHFVTTSRPRTQFYFRRQGPEQLTWERAMDGGVGQFVFELSGKQLSVGYQVKRPPATDWTLVDSLSCSQKQ